MAQPRVLVIGGGLAGLAATMRLAEIGVGVDLVSLVPVKRSQIGLGPPLQRVLEPLGVECFIETAVRARHRKRSGGWCASLYHRPPVPQTESTYSH